MVGSVSCETLRLYGWLGGARAPVENRVMEHILNTLLEENIPVNSQHPWRTGICHGGGIRLYSWGSRWALLIALMLSPSLQKPRSPFSNVTQESDGVRWRDGEGWGGPGGRGGEQESRGKEGKWGREREAVRGKMWLEGLRREEKKISREKCSIRTERIITCL